MSAIQVANYIIKKNNEMRKKEKGLIDLTRARMLKIVFFADVEYMKKNGEPLFEEHYHDSENGPICVKLDVAYSFYSTNDSNVNMYSHNVAKPSRDKRKVIDWVMKRAKNIETKDLIDMSKKVLNSTRKDEDGKLSKLDIYKFYKDREIFDAYQECRE